MTKLILAALLAACGGGSGAVDAGHDAARAIDAQSTDAPASPCPAPTQIATATTPEVTVTNDVGSTGGIFDPSVVYPAGAPAGAMAYSSVPDAHSIRTRIAVSADAGATWTFAAQANAPEAATIATSDPGECPTGACSGFLISEVSSLVLDADDPDPQQRWKLFAHRYLVEPNDRLHYRIGTIALQTAPAPEGPWTAPRKLIGWTSPSTYTTSGVATNASTLPALADCLLLTEPSALWHPGGLELAAGCVYLAQGAPKLRIVLLRSTDHAASWRGVGTLVETADSACRTSGGVNAANLFAVGNQLYVSATPGDPDGTYRGCLVFAIDDLAAAKIHRDAQGRAVPVRTIVPSPDQFAGACTFSAGGGGYQMAIGFLDQARRFRIFRAGTSGP